MNLLFICSKNKWRSRTAETIFKNRWSVKSAGTEKGAIIRVNRQLIEWSEIVFVMEKKHKDRLMDKYLDLLNDKTIIILDIPDLYPYMDKELIQHLEDVIPFHLENQSFAMKGTLDWQSKEVVNIFDEASLWSAPFGRLLLDHIPMRPNAKVLDIGFGTGFPLIELSQRFGAGATIYGIDIWDEAIIRAKEKIRVLQLENITIIEQSATQIPLPENELDLICSNLGVNNFDQKEEVLKECHRVLKQDGRLAITTNPMGTFKELFDLFEQVLKDLHLTSVQEALQQYIAHRNSQDAIEKEMEQMGFQLTNSASDQTAIRFVSAKAVLDHSLIRIGFLESWEQLIPKEYHLTFFNQLCQLIDRQIAEQGIFKMTIPMLYLEFKKQ